MPWKETSQSSSPSASRPLARKRYAPKGVPERPKNWVERLQDRPDGVKKQIAFGGAVGVTSVVALVWLVALSLDISSGGVLPKPEQGQEQPFASFFDSAKEQVATVKNAFSELDAPTAEEESAVATDLQELVDTTQTAGAGSGAATGTTTGTVPGEETQPEPARQPRTVLIGTSSSATLASTTTLGATTTSSTE